MGAPNKDDVPGKLNGDLRLISRYISKAVRDRYIVTIHE